jgi:uncharacterized peroxidase-related enzyme
VKSFAKDWKSVKLEPREAALVEFAVGLTLKPTEGREAAAKKLRAAGYDDEAIVQATEVAAYFNFVNRLANGLGVDLEEDGDRDYIY